MGTVETVDMEDLVRTLIKHAPAIDQSQNEERRKDGLAEEILLDFDVDGARYLLIRLPKPGQLPVQLSPREREIVRLVAQGHSNKVIAAVLSISSWTVSTHLRRIFAKLGVGSRAAMVAHASASPARDNARGSAVVITSGERPRQRFG
jgi:DNA-binding CsgD family transcriptional regulator